MTISALRAATLGVAGGITPAQVALLGLLSTLDRQIAQCSRAALSGDVFASGATVSDVTECASTVLADGVSATCSVASDRAAELSAVSDDAISVSAALSEDASTASAAIETC